MALSRADHDNEVVTSPINATVSATSASFTPQASSLLVLTVALHMTGNDPGTNTSVSGGGLTWTRATTQESSSAIYYGVIEIWTAPVGGSPAAMTITVTNPATELYGVAHVFFQVSSFTGYDTGTPVGTAGGGIPTAGGAYSFDLPASPASTSVVIAGRFWFPGASVDSTATPGSGWTEVYDYPTPTYGYGDLETEVRGSSTSTTVSWVNLNDNAAAVYFIAATAGAEIRAASGGAASTWLNSDFEQPRAARRAVAAFEQGNKLPPPIDVATVPPPLSWLTALAEAPRVRRQPPPDPQPYFVTPLYPTLGWLTVLGLPAFRPVLLPPFWQDRELVPPIDVATTAPPASWLTPLTQPVPAQRNTRNDFQWAPPTIPAPPPVTTLGWVMPLEAARRAPQSFPAFENARPYLPPIDVAGTPSMLWLTPFGLPPYRRVPIPQFHQDRKYDGPPPYVAPTVQQDAMMIFF